MFYDKTSENIIIRVRVTPNSSKCAISGIFTDANGHKHLKININAVPEKGKANQELIKFLSKWLNQSKSAFTLLSGETDRYKRIQIKTTNLAITEQILQQTENAYDSADS